MQFFFDADIQYFSCNKIDRAYLVNLATCYIPAAEVTSHPHLGGDDNANPFRTTEALRGEP